METTETIKKFIKAYNEHDATTLNEVIDNNAEAIFPTTKIVGRRNIVQHFAETFEKIIPDIHEEILNMAIQGNTAALEAQETGTFSMPNSKKPYKIRCAYIIHVNTDGLIDWAHSYWDTYPWSKQIGIPVESIHPEGK
jgi:ketosteroid isomerase-like protein